MSESTKVTINYFCVGALLIFIGCVLICSLGFTVLLPYEITRGWPTVTCRVLNATYSQHMCSCGDGYTGFDGGDNSFNSQNFQEFWSDQTFIHKANSSPSIKLPHIYHISGDKIHKRMIDVQYFSYIHSPVSSCISKFPCLQIYVEYDVLPLFDKKIEEISTTLEVATVTDHVPPTVDESLLPRAIEVFTSSTPSSKHSSRLTPFNQMKSSFLSDFNFATDDVNDQFKGKYKNTTESQQTGNSTKQQFETQTTNKKPTREMNIFKMTLSSHNLLEEMTKTVPNNSLIISGKRQAQLFRSWDDSFHAKCSLTECGDEIWNFKENRRFKMDWGSPGQKFTCYYNPVKPHIVILEKTSSTIVFHAIFWPTLSVLVGAILWICLCYGCCKAGGKDSACKEKYKIVS